MATQIRKRCLSRQTMYPQMRHKTLHSRPREQLRFVPRVLPGRCSSWLSRGRGGSGRRPGGTRAGDPEHRGQELRRPRSAVAAPAGGGPSPDAPAANAIPPRGSRAHHWPPARCSPGELGSLQRLAPRRSARSAGPMTRRAGRAWEPRGSWAAPSPAGGGAAAPGAGAARGAVQVREVALPRRPLHPRPHCTKSGCKVLAASQQWVGEWVAAGAATRGGAARPAPRRGRPQRLQGPADVEEVTAPPRGSHPCLRPSPQWPRP